MPDAHFDCFWFGLLGHGIQRITGLFVVYTCVFAFLGLQATCTAAHDGSLCMALRVVGGQVIATLVVWLALFLPCFDDIIYSLTHAGSVVGGRFAATLLAVGSALYAFRGGDFVYPPPRLLCGCLFGLYMFVYVDSVRPVVVAQGCDVFPHPGVLTTIL